VDRDGLAMRPAEAIMRRRVRDIPMGLLLAVVEGQRRSLQDIVFGSRVTYERRRHALFAQPAS